MNEIKTENNFADFGITSQTKSFSGDSIKLTKLKGKRILVLDYKITKSKYPDTGNGMRLDLWIEYEGEKRVTWTSSVPLQEMILQVDKSRFPFNTTITEVNDSFQFA